MQLQLYSKKRCHQLLSTKSFSRNTDKKNLRRTTRSSKLEKLEKEVPPSCFLFHMKMKKNLVGKLGA